jgi:methylthioribose-1-phosphate isomerase
MKAVDWIDGKVRFIDQTLLPGEERYVETDDITVVAEAIKSLRIRGAPAIGVAAGFGVVLGVRPSHAHSSLLRRFDEAVTLLGSTRPTAVNLFNVLNRMRAIFLRTGVVEEREAVRMLECEALAIQREDIAGPSGNTVQRCFRPGHRC